jgi:hypothetical protein
MFWNEKIELIKKQFSVADFKDPFSMGTEIIEKICRKLHGTSRQNFENTIHKETLIKNVFLLKNCTIESFYKEELPNLSPKSNFWVMLSSVPMGADLRIYDCKYEPLRTLLGFLAGQDFYDFYIISKKYTWLFYFKIDCVNDIVEIYTTDKTILQK